MASVEDDRKEDEEHFALSERSVLSLFPFLVLARDRLPPVKTVPVDVLLAIYSRTCYTKSVLAPMY